MWVLLYRLQAPPHIPWLHTQTYTYNMLYLNSEQGHETSIFVTTPHGLISYW